MSDLVNGEPEGEAVQGEDGEEQEATLVKKHMKLESELGEEEETAKKENVDDKTEDQVPDITLEDPMTTSMDGIEEISATEGEAAKENGEAQEGEGGAEGAVQPEEEEAAGDKAAEDETTEKDAAEIPVNVYEEGGEGEKAAEAGEEPAPAGEEVVEEEKVEEKPEEEETTPAAPAEEEAAAVEEQQQQPEAAEQPEMVEVPVEAEPEAEQKAEEPPPPKEEEQFELKAPPAPRKPRKTYKPDWMAEPEPKVEKTEAEEEKPAEQEEAPAEAPAEPEPAAADEVSIEVEKFGEEEAEKPAEESAPVEQGAPEEAEAAPKSGGAETVTPKSPRGRAFDFEKKAPAGKKTTFEDEVLSVKSSRSGRSGPRSPRSPRTPKTPTKAEEEVKPAAEEAAEVPPPEKTETGEEEEEKMRQRQTSYEERQREREEEEARWKRMTSWDRGEDGTIKEEEPKAPAVEAVEEEEVPKEAAEEAEAKPEEQEEAVPAEEEGVEKVEAEGGEEAMKVIEVEPEEAAAPAEEGEEEQKSAAEEQPVEGSPPPPPPRPERSPSPVQRREPAARDYLPYDQDLPKETVPSRLPAGESFSSWVPVERESYKPISPWVDRTSKYRNEYTVGEPPVAPSAYTAFFDDLVSTGPFASSLYSTSRLLERSRSRTRERRQALRSQSQARNYFRFASQHPPPLRSRDFSTPPSSMVSRAPTEASSFVSFMDYAGAKQYEMARSQSLQRTPLYQSNLALSRSISRGGIDYYLGSGRISRVDSYVDSLHNRYEWNLPSNYELYRASNRGQVSFAPLTNYQTYVDSLQRSLSRERYERDRLRNKYTTVSYQLEQALKQMDLLRSQNYSALRSGSAPRTSVYAHFYPYY